MSTVTPERLDFLKEEFRKGISAKYFEGILDELSAALRDAWVENSKLREHFEHCHSDRVVTLVQERDQLRARLADTEKERDSARAALEDRDRLHEIHVNAIEAERLRVHGRLAEVERERNEASNRLCLVSTELGEIQAKVEYWQRRFGENGGG